MQDDRTDDRRRREPTEAEAIDKTLRQIHTLSRQAARAGASAEALLVLIGARDQLAELVRSGGGVVARTSECPPQDPNCDPPEDPPGGGGP